MATTLRSLDARLRAVTERIERGIESLVAKVGAEIGEELVPATPVRTGYARANWRPTLRVPATRPVTFLDPTGRATIGRIRVVSQRFKLGDELFITNNAPYILRLNKGSSPQASAGFVRRAVRTAFDRALSPGELL